MKCQSLVGVIILISSVTSNILMPRSFFTSRSEGILENPTHKESIVEENNKNDAPSTGFEVRELSENIINNSQNNFQTVHARNCFFTPVQCMLPITDSHKDVQSLHGVYTPPATHVRRSVDSMLTSPWGYTDLIKRSGDNQFYQWLSRY